jgi:hypothetical protein
VLCGRKVPLDIGKGPVPAIQSSKHVE